MRRSNKGGKLYVGSQEFVTPLPTVKGAQVVNRSIYITDGVRAYLYDGIRFVPTEVR